MIVRETKLQGEGVSFVKRGKVRDIYNVDGRLLIIATDRISAFDVVLPTPIPDKGRILNRMSVFWFDRTKHIVPNHLLAWKVEDLPEPLKPYAALLCDRFMLVKKAQVIPIECVVRGYLYGSAWKDYQATGEVCGIKLPKGMKLAEKLPEPIFTPATKAQVGHDENITFEKVVELVGKDLAERLRDLSVQIYLFASKHAEQKNIIVADTKFEFGLTEDGSLILVDEILTPDSSRFWDAETYEPNKPQENFDKQFVRDYLEKLNWNKEPPAPELPPDVVAKTRERYLEAYRRITGEEL
ncbi:MAG: phosphoribosylaminoimidazolesuccinocarboxamide synthase [Armatimonadetes bacterium]|nr:phosphoribosylaminoimidazolesuccinocarboxamide synthase [Armatimonadota bacterium]MDW8027341.1 phosphoribosylaminoimidazolesuccinocarboxamide synthase [Armatimonadota bacterium]